MAAITTRIFPETLKEVKRMKSNHETVPQTLERLVKVAKKAIEESDL